MWHARIKVLAVYPQAMYTNLCPGRQAVLSHSAGGVHKRSNNEDLLPQEGNAVGEVCFHFDLLSLGGDGTEDVQQREQHHPQPWKFPAVVNTSR